MTAAVLLESALSCSSEGRKGERGRYGEWENRRNDKEDLWLCVSKQHISILMSQLQYLNIEVKFKR